MRLQRRLGGRAVPPRDGRDNRLVLAQRRRAPPLDRQRGGRQQRHRAVHEVKLLDQERIVRGAVDLRVKAPVRARKRLRIAQQRAVGRRHLFQHMHLFGRGMARRQPRRQPLELGPHHIEFRHLVMVERRHHQRPAVARQHRLRLEPLQRLADRRPADAEAVGKLALDQPVAGAVVATLDRLEDQGIGIALPGFRLGHRTSPPLVMRDLPRTCQSRDTGARRRIALADTPPRG